MYRSIGNVVGGPLPGAWCGTVVPPIPVTGCWGNGSRPRRGMGDSIGWGTLPPECGPMSVVQQNLGKVGFPVPITNKLDEATAYALVDFQIAHNIPAVTTSAQICAYLAQMAAGGVPNKSPVFIKLGPSALTQQKAALLLKLRPGGSLLTEGGTIGTTTPTTKKHLLYGGAALLVLGGVALIMRRKKR